MEISGHTIKPQPRKDSTVQALEKDTLYLPGIFGQWHIWGKRLNKIIPTVHTVIQMGNIIGFHQDVKSAKHDNRRGYNAVLVENILSNWVNSTTDGNGQGVEWVQLIGANELTALTDANNEDSGLDDYSAQLLRETFFAKKSPIQFAYAHNDRLVTHGGLTYGLWEELGKPKKAKKAAQLINERYKHQLYLGASLRTGSPPNLSADPVFCDDLHELYPSWIYAEEKCPFEQVFAQTINSVRGRHAKNSEYSPMYWLDDTCFSYPRFGSVLNIRDTQFIGLDIGLNTPRKTSIDNSRKLWIEKSFG